MAYTNSVQLKGDDVPYKLSPNIKKYSLRDTGFQESKNGRFQLERSLDPSSPHNNSFLLKITVKADLKNLKMATTTANGLQEVNIFKHKNADVYTEQLNYILKDLIERDVLVKG